MKKITTSILIIIILATTLYVTNNKDNKINYPDIKPTIKQENNKIDQMINDMTLEEKIGQMMIIAYRKPKIDNDLINILNKVNPGGFIFFSENFESYKESKELINNIINTAKIPMFLATDQEGGRINRFKNIKDIELPTIPSMEEIGQNNNKEEAYNTGKTIAEELKLFNINMDMAPVIDINTSSKNKVIGNRSFGNNPTIVSSMSEALAKGLRDNNIIPVYKHFPGHGNTIADSHKLLPIIKKSKEELLNYDLIPFKNAINNNAEVIMIGHLAVPSITNSEIPASLSKEIITDLLKEELKYQNLVITDALNMKAITDNYGDEEVYELAINAGVDILLMPNNPIEAIDTIKELVKQNKISEEKINNSVKKILLLKEKYNIL